MARSRLERSSKMTTEERKAEDARFRQEYPLFAQYPELIYLDNAATTQKPSCVIKAEAEFYEKYNGCNLQKVVANLRIKPSIKKRIKNRIIKIFKKVF